MMNRRLWLNYVEDCMPNESKQDETQDQGGQRGGSGNFANDPQRASEAGKKGGQASGGNFANDPARASEAGKKGGQSRGEDGENE